MLHLLETFCAVADTGSLSRAADVLHVTQPAITRQIKALEAQLGAMLLSRTAHGVELTPAGQAVLPHARQALAAVAACKGAVAAATADSTGQLRIAAGLQVTQYSLPPAIARFQARYPQVQIDLRPDHHQGAIDMLLAYQVDVACFGHDMPLPGLRYIPLFQDPLMLVTAPQHARPEPAPLAELQGQTLLAPPAQSGVYAEVQRVLERTSIRCRLVEYPSVETLKTALMLGMGQAILPTNSVRAEVQDGRLAMRTLADWPDPPRTIRAVMRAEGPLPPAVRDFIAVVREVYGTLPATVQP